MGRVRVGVAGWSYPDWEGIVYPPRKPSRFDPLSFLTSYFDTVEVNTTFYRPVPPRMAASWARRSEGNPEFRFTVKLYRAFTHDGNATQRDERAVKEVLDTLAERNRLGALLIQFPWSYKNQEDSRRYLADLLDRFRDYPRVVEVRHASWGQEDLYEELTEKAVGFCNIDQPRLARSLGPSEKSTAPVGYVRLHGRNYRDWFRAGAGRDARYDYLYTAEELEPWLDKIGHVADSSSETYVITNNHFRGQAAVNALQIKSHIEKKTVEAPSSLVRAYPILERVVTSKSRPAQKTLF